MKKKIYFSNEKELAGMREVAKAVDFGVGLAVMWAFSEIISTYCAFMEHKHLFRHEVKQLCKRAVRMSELRSVAIKSNMKSGSFWEDYSDAVIDAANNDVTVFRLALKKTLDDAKCKYSELYAYAECARVLLDMSVKYYDTIIDNAKQKYGKDCSSDFREYRVGDILQVWDEMCRRLFVGSANLNTPRVDAAFAVMCKKFANGDYISQCLEEAHRKNPDFLENNIEVVE